ncbi:MAG: hypothetical protein LBP53_04460 [Candidatus Peribacteria bacterium]|jgi:hypothetical protein|nr:hypothetical protein [Candidatus Peribacteria bacterium]
MDTKLNVLNLQFSGIKNQLSGIDIKFNEFTKIEEKIDLLSGDNSVLQEIQNTLRSLKMTQ